MTDSISKVDVLETYADLYDVFDDNKLIRIELDKVYDKLNGLKEQEARVLSRGELVELERAQAPCVWLEVKEIKKRYWFEGWAEPVHFDETEIHLYGFGVGIPVEAKLRDYGVEYRCWNYEPTEAQMKAVPWNE